MERTESCLTGSHYCALFSGALCLYLPFYDSKFLPLFISSLTLFIHVYDNIFFIMYFTLPSTLISFSLPLDPSFFPASPLPAFVLFFNGLLNCLHKHRCRLIYWKMDNFPVATAPKKSDSLSHLRHLPLTNNSTSARSGTSQSSSKC